MQNDDPPTDPLAVDERMLLSLYRIARSANTAIDRIERRLRSRRPPGVSSLKPQPVSINGKPSGRKENPE